MNEYLSSSERIKFKGTLQTFSGKQNLKNEELKSDDSLFPFFSKFDGFKAFLDVLQGVFLEQWFPNFSARDPQNNDTEDWGPPLTLEVAHKVIYKKEYNQNFYNDGLKIRNFKSFLKFQGGVLRPLL